MSQPGIKLIYKFSTQKLCMLTDCIIADCKNIFFDRKLKIHNYLQLHSKAINICSLILTLNQQILFETLMLVFHSIDWHSSDLDFSDIT